MVAAAAIRKNWKLVEAGGAKKESSIAHEVKANPPEIENTSFLVIGRPNDQSTVCTKRKEKNEVIAQNATEGIDNKRPAKTK